MHPVPQPSGLSDLSDRSDPSDRSDSSDLSDLFAQEPPMPPFASPDLVRLKLSLDTAAAPDPLVEDCIADAHRELLARLRPDVVPAAHADALASGEALLAAARLLRRIGAAAAAAVRSVSVGGQRVDVSARAGAVNGAADTLEDEGWAVLAPLLLPVETALDATVTPTQPVVPA